jgi:hypothetical protein
VHRADFLTTFVFRLSVNLGAINSWEHQGLTGFSQGFIYRYVCTGDVLLVMPSNTAAHCRELSAH